MRSEALRGVRTMRQVNTGLDIIQSQRPRTTNSLSKTSEEVEHLETLTDPRLVVILEKERRRFAAQQMVVNRSRQRMLRAREKLSATINKNHALMELRHELQQGRLDGEEPASQVFKSRQLRLPVGERSFNHVELEY